MKILHLADIQIKTERNKAFLVEMYKNGMEKILSSAKAEAPDCIVIVGDLFEVYNPSDLSRLTMRGFIQKLSDIAPVFITAGNHDLQQSGFNYVETNGIKTPAPDALEVLSNGLDRVHYMSKTGMHEFSYWDDDIVFAVWSHKDKIHGKKYNPWENATKVEGKIYIDLFHDPVSTAKTRHGIGFAGANRVSIEDFKGDYFLLGDIHNHQKFRNANGAIGCYPSSPIARDFGEGTYYEGTAISSEMTHGYAILDTDAKAIRFKPMEEAYSYHTVMVEDGQDKLILNASGKVILKLVFRKFDMAQYNAILASLDNYDVVHIEYEEESSKASGLANSDELSLDEISSPTNLISQFSDYMSVQNISPTVAEKAIAIFSEIANTENIDAVPRSDIRVLEVHAKNYRTLGSIIIDIPKNGIIRVDGDNGVGKSTVVQIIPALLWGKNKTNKGGNTKNKNILSFFNDKSKDDLVELKAVFSVNTDEYEIQRNITRAWKYNKPKYGNSDWMDYAKAEQTLAITKNGVGLGLDFEESESLIVSLFGDYETYANLYEVSDENLTISYGKDEDIINTILKSLGLDIIETIGDKSKAKKKEWEQKETILRIDPKAVNQEISDLIATNQNISKEIASNGYKISALDAIINEKSAQLSELRSSLKPYDSKLAIKYGGADPREAIATIVAKVARIKAEMATSQDFEAEKSALENKIAIITAKASDTLSKRNHYLLEKGKFIDDISTKKREVANIEQRYQKEYEEEKKTLYIGKESAREQLDGFRQQYNAILEENKIAIATRLDEARKNRDAILKKMATSNQAINEKESYIDHTERLGECSYCNKKIAEVDEVRECLAKAKEVLTSLNIERSAIMSELALIDGNIVEIQSLNPKDDDRLTKLAEHGKVMKETFERLEKEHQELSVEPFKAKYQYDLDTIALELKNIEEAIEAVNKIDADLLSEMSSLKEEENITRRGLQAIEAKILSTKVKLDEIATLENDRKELWVQQEYLEYNTAKTTTISELEMLINQKNSEKTAIIIDNASLQSKGEANSKKVGELEGVLAKAEEQSVIERAYDVIKKACSKKELPIAIFRKIADKLNANMAFLLEGLPFKVHFDMDSEYPSLTFSDFSSVNPSHRDIKECSGMERTFSVMALKFQMAMFAPISFSLMSVDEVTGKLKKHYADTMAEVLNKLSENMTIIFIDHNIDNSKLSNCQTVTIEKRGNYSYAN